MSVPQKIANFMDANGDTLQNAALLAYLKNGDEAKPFLEAVTTTKVWDQYCLLMSTFFHIFYVHRFVLIYINASTLKTVWTWPGMRPS